MTIFSDEYVLGEIDFMQLPPEGLELGDSRIVWVDASDVMSFEDGMLFKMHSEYEGANLRCGFSDGKFADECLLSHLEVAA